VSSQAAIPAALGFSHAQICTHVPSRWVFCASETPTTRVLGDGYDGALTYIYLYSSCRGRVLFHFTFFLFTCLQLCRASLMIQPRKLRVTNVKRILKQERLPFRRLESHIQSHRLPTFH